MPVERGTGTDDRRVLVALGGNALGGPTGSPEAQVANVGRSMRQVAELLADGWRVVLTHGNGPQVGDLVHRDELNAGIAPPYPLDWAVAETQATLGHVIANALGAELVRRDLAGDVAALVSRVLVDADDPAFASPTKPIGPWLSEEPATLEVEGPVWREVEGKGWRRVVASPEPRASLDLPAVRALVDAGVPVIANGGGGIPTVRDRDGSLRGVPAVIDKDLAGAVLGCELGVPRYVVLTDVPGVAVDHGTADERWLGAVTVSDLRRHQADGQFPAGSMGPKVEAVCRFVEHGGGHASIGAIDDLPAVLAGDGGTQVRPA